MAEVEDNAFDAGGIEDQVAKLLAYCRKREWSGIDPYDALNSRLFNLTPLRNSRFCRLALIQGMKRLPVNIRPLLLISPEPNAKATALFLTALLKLSRSGFQGNDQEIEAMIERLVALRSPGSRRWCWGYSFPWQTRNTLVPKGAPNLVCTSFVANALLDAYEETGDLRCAEMAIDAARYILEELYWSEADGRAGFSYPMPGGRAQVHNANFLGAALLCRVHGLSGDREFLEAALRAARYSAGRQEPDGSWYYGEGHKKQWIDNFHTGFNLCALHAISTGLGSGEFDSAIRLGFQFYRGHFFREDGAVAYFHNRLYPLDIHCVAQSIITLVTFKELDRGNLSIARRVLQWANGSLWDEDGYFYYQRHPLFTNRISYMRWSQAWMLLALAALLEAVSPLNPVEPESGA